MPGIRGLPFRPAWSSVCTAVLRPIPRGCRCARQTFFMRGGLLLWPARNMGWTSVRPGAVHVAVLRSAQHRIRDVLLFGPSRHMRRSFVLPSEAFGMRGGLPTCRAWLLVCAADFLHAWRSSLPARCGHRYARRSCILARHGRQFVWRSSVLPGAAAGVRSRLPSYAVVFGSARSGPRGGLPFYPARLSVYGTDFLRAVHGVAGSS